MYPFRFLGHTTQRRPGRGFLSAVPVCSPFSLAVEPEGTHAAYAHARIARTSVAFRALKPITPYGKPFS
jgi:hypothetical protein